MARGPTVLTLPPFPMKQPQPQRLDLDPSYPYQLGDKLLAIWLPRGRGRDARAPGLLIKYHICTNPECNCTEAIMSAYLINDRLKQAKAKKASISIVWRENEERIPEAVPFSFAFDFCTGQISPPRGSELPESVACFLREPIPSWVMDDLFEEWAAERPLLDFDWKERALRTWEPGDLLSEHLSLPEGRPDLFFREGKFYVVDFMFCATPSCGCSANRLVVLEVKDAKWTQIGSIELKEDLTPDSFSGDPQHQSLVNSIYLDWCARSGDPRERFDSIRSRVRERGKELWDLWHARSAERAAAQKVTRTEAQPSAPVPQRVASPLSALSSPMQQPVSPGRNSPCPCGSGKKWKRCCGSGQ